MVHLKQRDDVGRCRPAVTRVSSRWRVACHREAAGWPQLQTSPPGRHVQPGFRAASPNQPAPCLTFLFARLASLEARGSRMRCRAGWRSGERSRKENKACLKLTGGQAARG